MSPINKQSGFSLMEMLMVLVVTLIVLAGTFQVFKGAMQVNEISSLKSDADENFRAAFTLVTQDLMQAGQGIPTGGIPIPTGTGISAIKRPGPAGSNLILDSTLTTFPAVVPGQGLGPTFLGQTTDVITVLYADNTLVLNQIPLQAIATDGSTMTVDSTVSITGSNGIAAGDLILFSNAVGNAIQMVTSVNGTQTVTMGAGDSMHLNQRTAAQGTILQLKSGGTFPLTTATRIWMITYFLDVTTDPVNPRLMRKINNNTERTMAIGLENLQLTFDLVDGVTNPTDVANPTTPNQIRKANLFLAVRSSAANFSGSQVFRSNLRTQISFRSLAFVDRYK